MNKYELIKYHIAIDKLSEKHVYPMSFEKDMIGGSFADAFNAGYNGREGGIYRFEKGSVGYMFYNAGKIRKAKDLRNRLTTPEGGKKEGE